MGVNSVHGLVRGAAVEEEADSGVSPIWNTDRRRARHSPVLPPTSRPIHRVEIVFLVFHTVATAASLPIVAKHHGPTPPDMVEKVQPPSIRHCLLPSTCFGRCRRDERAPRASTELPHPCTVVACRRYAGHAKAQPFFHLSRTDESKQS